MTKNKKGFTIIEVVLVLAIAGLIFLMVFIALPALQRSQRNTRRRQDMSRILGAFNDYQANNNGKMPPYGAGDDAKQALANLVNNYITGQKDYVTASTVFSVTDCQGNDQFCDPDGTSYQFEGRGKVDQDYIGDNNASEKHWSGVSGFNHKIIYYTNAKCADEEGGVLKGTGVRDIAIFYTLEGGSIYCGDNQ